jgi:hypothetical protein
VAAPLCDVLPPPVLQPHPQLAPLDAIAALQAGVVIHLGARDAQAAAVHERGENGEGQAALSIHQLNEAPPHREDVRLLAQHHRVAAEEAVGARQVDAVVHQTAAVQEGEEMTLVQGVREVVPAVVMQQSENADRPAPGAARECTGTTRAG